MYKKKLGAKKLQAKDFEIENLEIKFQDTKIQKFQHKIQRNKKISSESEFLESCELQDIKLLTPSKNKLSPDTPAKDYNLTTQEKKVLQLLVQGKSYKMIAAELFVATDTVKTHVSNVYAKLHVHSGTEAVSLAIRDKIV